MSQKKGKKLQTLEEGILHVQHKAKHAPLSLREILLLLPGKGQTLTLLLLSLPFCQPLQIPGLSTPFGLVIALISLRLAFHQRLWLPDKILSKKIPTRTLKKITEKALFLIRKLKRWIHPRLSWVCQRQKLHGLTLFFLGLLLALPLPIPFSNLTAAWAIFLIALGLLEDDGALILAGYAILLATLALLVVLLLSLSRL